MNECPKCHDSTGYYMLSRVSGLAKISFHFDGSDGDSSDMHDSIAYKDLKTMRCLNCHAIVHPLKKNVKKNL